MEEILMIPIKVSTEELKIALSNTHIEDLLDIFCDVEGRVQDINFTRQLRKYLSDITQEEDDIYDIATEVVTDWTNNQIFELICEINSQADDDELTQKLKEYFNG
jgi:hypothetical protein